MLRMPRHVFPLLSTKQARLDCKSPQQGPLDRVTGSIGILALTTITETPPLPYNQTSSGSIEATSSAGVLTSDARFQISPLVIQPRHLSSPGGASFR